MYYFITFMLQTGEVTSSSEYDSSITQQTFFLDCSKVIGDIIYITDTEFDEENGIIVGHSISEVGVFGAGKQFGKCKHRSFSILEFRDSDFLGSELANIIDV